MDTKASTAALSWTIQRWLLNQRRAPRHPAAEFTTECEEDVMKTKFSKMDVARAGQMERSFRRRIMGIVLLGILTALPVMATAQSSVRRVVHVSHLNKEAIENLQRWVSAGHDSWCKNSQMVASAEMQRLALGFSGYRYDQTALPIESRTRGTRQAVYTYYSADGHTAYRITLRRYSWLQPIAGNARSIVWVPAKTEVISSE